MSIFDDKQIDLDLNGPILSFTTNPTGVGSTGVGINSTGGGTVSLTGIATATFPTSANNAGYVTYRWYEEGVGALSDSTYVTGTATTTLTLSNLITPTDDGRKFYLEADYVPSYYVTGNATNEPFNSGIGTVTVDPLIEIIAQPTSATTIADQSVTFTLDASLTNDGTDLAYQWQLDGEDVTDGTVTQSTVSEIVGTTDNIIRQSGTGPFTIPANVTDIKFDCAAGSGGKGGGNGGYVEGGAGGSAISQWFILPTSTSARTVRFVIGGKGQDGATGGHGHAHGAPGVANGGTSGNGSSGNGCGGGAGGGATAVYVDGVLAAVLGGGGGGGGGGVSGAIAPTDGEGYRGGGEGMTATTGLISTQAGGRGQSGDRGAGGGGGGGGAPGGGGGSGGGFSNRLNGGNSGNGGKRGASAYRSDILSLWSGSRNPNSGGYAGLSYIQGQTETTTVGNVTRTTTVSGSTSKILTLSTDGPGIGYTVCASVSSATASNSPIKSDYADYRVLDSQDQSIIVIEAIGVETTATVSELDLNADEDGDVEISPASPNVDNNIFTQFYSIFAKDRDLDVEMDLYGGGSSDGSSGEGGYSRIRFTMAQNEEYVIAGLIDSINTPFVYRKGALMACVGEGGKTQVVQNTTFGGTELRGRGGAGGGIGIAGISGTRQGAGVGGPLILDGQLTLQGVFGSAFGNTPLVYPGDQISSINFTGQIQTGGNGGRTIRCAKGVYWAQQGLAPCDDISGSTQFRLSDGTVVTNTTAISRGFKAGYNIMQTAGGDIGFGARGGNGATGGSGGLNASGGGGSGYQDGTVTVVDTRLGGSTEHAKVLLRMQS